ncbi:MAG: hypothetical protein NDJ89_17680 [Oligoflexia bacterium]|nr:hypothetical protein [Oligoflexia bacterium]
MGQYFRFRCLSLLLLGNTVLAVENPCSDHFRTIPLIQNYYALDQTTRNALEKFRKTALDERRISSDAQISQSLTVKPIGSNWTVQFPYDKGKWTSIYHYGGPYEDSGTFYIDFKVWDREWSTASFRHDRDSPFLRRMPFDDFFDLTRSGYKSFLERTRYVALPKKDDPTRLDLLRLEPMIESPSDSIMLQTLDGEKRSASLKELMFWNIGMKDSERRAFRDFLDSGGIGEIVRVEPPSDLRQSTYQGFYLQVQKLASSESPGKSALTHPDTVSLLQSSISKGVIVAVTDDSKGMHAAVGGISSPLGVISKGEPANILVVTPTTDAAIVVHESVHIQDNGIGLKSILLDEFKRQYPDGNVGVEPELLRTLFQYVLEQRAYAAANAVPEGQSENHRTSQGIPKREGVSHRCLPDPLPAVHSKGSSRS